MSKILFILIFIFSGSLLATTLPDVIVDSEWLNNNKEKVIILSVYKKAASYETGHIPDAHFIPWSKLREDKQLETVTLIKMVVPAEKFTQLMREAGVNQDSAIVISYKGENSRQFTFATRLYWTLKYYGHENIAILNGGDESWKQAGFALTTEIPETTTGNFTAMAHPEFLADISDVKQAIKTQSTQLIDTRTLPYHLGTVKKSYVYALGHIPASKVIPHPLMMEYQAQGHLLDRNTLKAMVIALGADLDKPVITYCNSAHLATGLWFVLHEMLGVSEVALYDGSMHEWTKDANNPVVTMKME